MPYLAKTNYFMEIYMITNKVNNKKYVGQTTKTGIERFKAHIAAAFKYDANFKLSRALRKYGVENFSIETLKECSSKNELNFFEKYFIEKFDTLKNGYNMTIGGEGGDTYCEKSELEMKQIKNKISLANSFGNNGNAHQIYMKNIVNNEIKKFGSLTECKKWFKENLNLDIDRPGSKNIYEAEKFGFQVPILGKYIFSNTIEFSPYTFSKPCSAGGGLRWRVDDKNGKFIYGANTTKDLLSRFNWSSKTFIEESKKMGYIITRFGGRNSNEKCRVME